MLGLFFMQALAAQALLRLAAASYPAYPPPTSSEHKRAEPTHFVARQNSDRITVTIAPDSVCGYLSPATQTDPRITCGNGLNCSWGSGPYAFIFCGSAVFQTRCYPREEALDDALCDEACRNNSANLKCTHDELRPSCITFGYPDGVRGYQCKPTASLKKADFTLDGQTDRNFDTTVLVDEEAQPTSTTETTEHTSTTETTEHTSTTETTESTEAPRTTSTKSESRSSQTQTETASGNNGGGVPVAAIVGGVVGGLAVVTMLILGVLFLRRRPHRDDSAVPPVDHSSMAVQQAIGSPPTTFSAGTTEVSSPTTMTHGKHLSQASFPPRSETRTPPAELQTNSIVS
ncbi:hypothetical protein EDB80DRAFT_774338 [Ilyonectria destructans]|nr:hypothetical protein EDB80DRAFT_774338 [Ilyonectria destructans]